MRRTHGGPSGPSGASPSKFDVGRFVAWDGEGMTEHNDGCSRDEGCGCPHRYVYLANSEGGELAMPDGIPTVQALGFLTSEAARFGKDATHVAFGLSYDANMILGDLSRRQVEVVWEGERARVARRFKVAYRPRKSLWVKDYRARSSLTVWDPFGFYQSSFVKAVENNLGADYPLLPVIREGKARRSVFVKDDLTFIRRYTGAELKALVDLMRHLLAALKGARLTLSRWDGAGAIASSLLRREGVKVHMAICPDEVREAALYAYYGGHIETYRFGYSDGPIYHGDIRSAYPTAMLCLPSLKNGKWRRCHHDIPSRPFAVSKVRWDFRRLGDRWSVLPFPFRSSGSAIYFPRRGTTWVWRPELDAALKHPDLARRIEILDGWEFVERDPTLRPFDWIRRVYAERLRLRDEGNAAEKPLKLGMNSSYGKIAQHVGGTVEKPPPFHQLEWAGFITSHTRAALFDVASQVRSGVITLATDGIYSTERLPPLKEGKQLGDWELAVHDAMVIAQSGVYFLRDRRERSDGCDECGGRVKPTTFGCVRCADPACGWTNLVEHYRGFDEGTLDPDRILAAWSRRELTVEASSTRFVTMGRACRSDASFGLWRRWVTEPRLLDIHATGKRLDRTDPTAWTRKANPARMLLPTDPSDPFELESHPYSLAWAMEADGESADAQEQTSL